MRTLKCFLVLIVLGCATAAPVRAAELVRNASQIEAMPIQGVTLATPPKEAVERLLAAGYRAGKVKSYADWKGRELALEPGGPGAPEGESWVTLARHKGQLTQITEQTNQPRKRFDANAEIGAIRRHSGSARIIGSAGPTLTARGTAVFRTLTRPRTWTSSSAYRCCRSP